MLRHVKANRHRRRVALANLDIDVAHTRIERALVRVGNLVVRRNRALRHGRHAAGHALSLADAREQGHDAQARLKARRAGRKHERRPRRAVAHEPHGAPDVDRLGHDVTAWRHQHDAAGRRGASFVHRRLQARAVVGVVVAAHAEGLRSDVDRLGIVRPRGEDGLGGRRAWHGDERGGNQASDHVERHWGGRHVKPSGRLPCSYLSGPHNERVKAFIRIVASVAGAGVLVLGPSQISAQTCPDPALLTTGLSLPLSAVSTSPTIR